MAAAAAQAEELRTALDAAQAEAATAQRAQREATAALHAKEEELAANQAKAQVQCNEVANSICSVSACTCS